MWYGLRQNCIRYACADSPGRDGSDANMASSAHRLSARWLSKFVSSGHPRSFLRLVVERHSSSSSALFSGTQLYRIAANVSLWRRRDALTLRGLTGKVALARRVKVAHFQGDRTSCSFAMSVSKYQRERCVLPCVHIYGCADADRAVCELWWSRIGVHGLWCNCSLHQDLLWPLSLTMLL